MTRLTPQALYYNSRESLKHKLLAIEEQAGIDGADYVIRTMQSSNMITLVTTTKEPQSGRLIATEHKVEGPIACLLTTTNLSLNFENMNRCLIITMDESENQTKLIQHNFRLYKKLFDIK